jgi:glycosyltransferase involved in cell wall biosynthesis
MITFITVCKGRLHHLQQTLPLMVALNPPEIIVVDYDCPDRTSEWVTTHFSNVKVVQVVNESIFNVSRGRNLGADSASQDWLFFIDADVLISSHFNDWLSNVCLDDNNFYRPSFFSLDPKKENLGTYGSVICSKKSFNQIEGYDESFCGWGGEDNDFYFRLTNIGCREEQFTNSYLKSINHSDDIRTLYTSVKGKDISELVNQYYTTAKKFLISILNPINELPLFLRRDLMDQVRRNINVWLLKPNGKLPTFSVKVNLSTIRNRPSNIGELVNLNLTFADPKGEFFHLLI